MWAKKWLLGRDRFTHLNLLNFIRNDSPEDYKNYLRMSDENVQYLIAKVKPLIAKQDTVMRNALHLKNVSQRLFVFSPLDGRLKISSLPRLYHLKLWAKSFQRRARPYMRL